jgi:archaellum component FlaC
MGRSLGMSGLLVLEMIMEINRAEAANEIERLREEKIYWMKLASERREDIKRLRDEIERLQKQVAKQDDLRKGD